MADTLSSIGAIGAPVVGGLIGGLLGQNDSDQAQALLNATIQQYQQIGIPSVQAQQLALQQFQNSGQLTPQMENAVKQGSSAMNGISVDPNNMQASENALSSLQNIGNSGGMTMADQANLQNSLGQAAQQNRGEQGAILANARASGQMGSGSALSAQLQAQQNAATNANSAALNTAGSAQQRALTALQSAGQLGGQLNQQQFGQGAQVAQANDMINNWNAQNSAATQQRNVQNSNAAQAANLSNAQNISNQNTNQANYQQQYNKGLQQTNFNNQMQVAGAEAGARQGAANQLNNQAQQTANTWGGIGSGVGQAAGAIGQQNAQDNRYNNYMSRAYPGSGSNTATSSNIANWSPGF